MMCDVVENSAIGGHLLKEEVEVESFKPRKAAHNVFQDQDFSTPLDVTDELPEMTNGVEFQSRLAEMVQIEMERLMKHMRVEISL
ncbi:hypothetical protein LIER_29840 [Lithospermum erythrorhizon]|uniref:Uncharacterized protein n=1 Tax=Lithospermum erythrorhizon TaxID=34254 RepID=A0AAV3RM24_LITER